MISKKRREQLGEDWSQEDITEEELARMSFFVFTHAFAMGACGDPDAYVQGLQLLKKALVASTKKRHAATAFHQKRVNASVNVVLYDIDCQLWLYDPMEPKKGR